MKRFIILGLVVLFALTGCDDALELTPESSISEDDFYQNTDQVEAALVGCYDGLQLSVQTEYVLCEIRSDNTTTLLGEGEFQLIDFFMETADNSITTNYWQLSYNTIFRANKVLEYLDVVDDASTKNRIQGEALFIRALNHFNLVRLFGNIPLITEVVLADDYEAYANVSADVTYAQIIEDLQTAASLLPASSDTEFSRASSGAANALLAKVYMTMGQYSNALPLLQSITTSGQYGLQSTYAEVFENEENDEMLFSIVFESGVGGEGQVYSSEFTPTGTYSGLNNPTTTLINNYESADSSRYNASITSDLLCGKYLSDASSGDAGNDWPVIRYADVLLLLGEAINEISGPTTEALDAMNQVRVRAGLEAYTATEITSKDAYRDAVELERIQELAFENHRWFDLLRTGKALEVMNAQGAELGFSVTEDNLLFLIPQREIDVSGGYLVQN